ncbi:circadian clock KaiB family protein [Chryseolinea sp. H1M3-3]|uniref:circadian clock KaiB family protein n=1 Tax=Chryseolinea sp. H1M3-3 TaxID=3034144 RepID=UPI0023EAD34F|nr:circadian clock KaiB family protein [Chryseolinea sp. H1M3-3]
MLKKLAQNKKVKKKAKDAQGEKYILQLFVAGILPNSKRAIINIKAICEKHLKGRYELEVIDIYQQPYLAVKEDIIAIPLLIRKFPRPEGRLVGDLSNTEKVLAGLNLV